MTSYSTEIRDIRKFGIIALIFFGLLCVLGILMKKTLPVYLFGFLALLGIGFIIIPDRMRTLYEVWLKVAHFLSKIVSVLILTVAYYLVITPSAIIKWVFGGRPLPVKPDENSLSYWVDRVETVQPKERFFKRY